jgi:cell wall-associated NlpC family hydrolase
VSDLVDIVNAAIGRPWERAGFDCWGFVREFYAQAYAIDLPAFPGVDGGDHQQATRAAESARASGDWLPVAVPIDGDAVLMGRRERAHHVGVWLSIDGGRIAHCDEAHGVCCHSIRQLASMGWGGFTYFRHRVRS